MAKLNEMLVFANLKLGEKNWCLKHLGYVMKSKKKNAL